MGMSTHATGYISPENEDYQKHKKVLLVCIEADIEELPKETAEYFGDCLPDESLLEEKLETEVPFTEYSTNMEEGFEILVKDIPKGVYKLRFCNSW